MSDEQMYKVGDFVRTHENANWLTEKGQQVDARVAKVLEPGDENGSLVYYSYILDFDNDTVFFADELEKIEEPVAEDTYSLPDINSDLRIVYDALLKTIVFARLIGEDAQAEFGYAIAEYLDGILTKIEEVANDSTD